MAAGEKTGGRKAGTPNKSTQRVKEFLGEVFEEAFNDPNYKKLLVQRIVAMQIDSRLLSVLLAYYAGRPAVSLDQSAAVNLAQLIAGTLADEAEEAEEE